MYQLECLPRRTEELISQSAAVRRSPRISNRLSQVTDSHQLHRYQVSSRASLGGGRSRRSVSRSVTPNVILNESGQSVPITEADEATGVPPHLYGKMLFPYLVVIVIIYFQ